MNLELENRIRSFPSAKVRAGVSAVAIESIEAAGNLRLPDEVRSFYQIFDGVDFHGGTLEFLSLAKADVVRLDLSEMGFNRSWCYWPLTENNDSNPFCVSCSGPLSGFVVQVFHDDSPKIKWRTFDSFLKATLDYISDDEWGLEFMPNEFEQIERTSHDIETAQALLREASTKPSGDLERGEMACFASWLLGEDQWAEVAKLLTCEDEYVRREVTDRLQAMSHPDARRVIDDSKREFQAFVNKCGEVLAKAGFRIGIDEHSQLQVLDGPIWLNTEMFYSDRDRPDLERFLIERTTHLVGLKRQRPS